LAAGVEKGAGLRRSCWAQSSLLSVYGVLLRSGDGLERLGETLNETVLSHSGKTQNALATVDL
jgi:hypothetical protein